MMLLPRKIFHLLKNIAFVFFVSSKVLCVHADTNQTQSNIKEWAQTYLNGLQAMVANFTQHNPDGSSYRGKIWIRRDKGSSGKMRLDYFDGPGQKVLALNDDLIVIEKNGEESSCPISSTPAAYILRKKIVFGTDVFVKKAELSKNKKHALLALGLEESDDDSEPGTLTIIFSVSPTQKGLQDIMMWEVVDMQGRTTTVEIDSSSLRVNDKRLVQDSVFNK
jgi:outer membrane lipoprotein-sorting protein